MTEVEAALPPDPVRSGRIFISYRREETAYPAGWLYDRLVDRFGAAQVFKDVDSIQLGDDFGEVIACAVGSCDMLVALIGDSWATVTDEHGRRRLDDPDDLVRLEIEAALSRQVRVIPILVDGAKMPSAAELPESLCRLVRRQALELSPSRFDTDLSRLVVAVEETLAEVLTSQAAEATPEAVPVATTGTAAERPPGMPVATSAERGRGSSRRRWVVPAIGGGVLLAALFALLAALFAGSGPSGDDEAGGEPSGSAAAAGVEVDTEPITDAMEITLSDLDFHSRNDPPLVGDTATVTYTLRNDSNEDITFDSVFVGVRAPEPGNRDAEAGHEGEVLAPGASLRAEGQRLMNTAGVWKFWPCYILEDGTYCEDEWEAIEVLVRQD